MKYILLDPYIYLIKEEYQGNELQLGLQYQYLEKLINFIDDYIDAYFGYSQYFMDLIITLKQNPWNQYPSYWRNTLNKIQRTIMRKLDYNSYISYQDIPMATPNFLMDLPQNTSKDYFLKYIVYANDVNQELLLFFSTYNQGFRKPVIFLCRGLIVEYFPVYNPYREIHDELRELLISGPGLSHYPTHDNLFPNVCICCEYNEMIREYRRDRYYFDASIIEIGREVALRNNYVESSELSAINSRYSHRQRKVFVSLGDNRIYLSLDFESSGFEVFNSNTDHLGQYSFDGRLIRPPSPHDHRLLLNAQ